MDKGSLSGLFLNLTTVFLATLLTALLSAWPAQCRNQCFLNVMNFLKKSKRHFICEKFTLKNNKKWLINYDNSILWIILIAV